jgi:hypothetical protein
MKKVLLVSAYPYNQTSRGMDVLTECFDEAGWDTSHLTFPKVFYTINKESEFESRVQEYTAKPALFPYIDGLMYWFPKKFFNAMTIYQALKADAIHFDEFDHIVLESGKPLFLLNIIPTDKKIIYRQSDSVRFVLGRNRYYIALEDTVLERAEKIIVVKDRFKDILPEEFQAKTTVIRNGYTIPKDLNLKNPYPANSQNAIYVGLTKLDVPTLKHISVTLPQLNLHIFGDCLSKIDLWQVRHLSNIFYHGFQPKEKYLPYIKFASLAIFPFKNWAGMKWVGFTTKYLNFLYFKLPVVSYLTGEESEFDGTGVIFARDKIDFARKIKKILETNDRSVVNLNFDFFSHASRKAEYLKFIRSLH